MQEKHAVLLLLGIAVAGHGARLLLSQKGEPPGQVLADSAPASDPIAHRDRALRLARPLARGETIDLNTASPEEIARLPAIGMSLAKRIVANRSSAGPFEGLSDLERVAGVGPALLEKLQGSVRFGGVIRRSLPPAPHGPSIGGSVSYAGAAGPVNVNSASETELRALPGIGPVRARALLAYRRDKGPFAAVSELRAVPGFTKSLVKKLEGLVTVR
jgi:competence protein ComEA